MLLYDLLKHTPYTNKVNIYKGSAYEYHLPIFCGNVGEAREDENVFSYMMEKVEYYNYCTGEMLIIVRDDDYEKCPEQILTDKQPSYFDRNRSIEKRIWRTLSEIEEEMKLKSQLVKTGYWVNDGISSWDECSECGARIETCDLKGDVLPKNFCPECGAKMSGWKTMRNKK